MTVFATARTLSIGATLLAATLTSAYAQSYPVTATQRSTAQQVAQQGIPESELAAGAPEHYTVKRGDTLWGISGLYLRKPWRWPDLWGMNLGAIANPHLIYPGQVLYLVRSNGYARLSTTAPGGEPGVVRLSPHTRESSLSELALPTLPPHLIEPFLAEPLIVDAGTLQRAPRIIATTDKRVLMASGDRAYVRSSDGSPVLKQAGSPASFRVFRDAKPLKDPITAEVLGYEAKYLGLAKLVDGESVVQLPQGNGGTATQASPATVDLVKAKNEIYTGDRLLPAPPQEFINYVPHAPQADVNATVVSIYGDSAVLYASQNQVIAINRGQQDGMDIGTVLEVISTGARIVDKTTRSRDVVQLPDERNGYAMVFKVFDRVSYALITTAQRGVTVGDKLVTPTDH
ncbi:LysM peptidoglycan-binding domain-containing protein [Comamonas sp. lk]|uniref:LysM peptidoglycan-binding domain-containing protein n=1 Tax=Comamonas sp. lk TaxID=2201272 RepID=UPI000EAB5ED3|nr:LysM peptidoglycan-binding domain-containing protein [Comamonas sp. lk]